MSGDTAAIADAARRSAAAWSGYLSSWQEPGAATAPALLGPEETARLERYRDRLLAASPDGPHAPGTEP
ncbi:hypothetical protein, partial [Azospirillum brasilense]|uniref:hypothetical protein n=1 Tax=Azospirillum brasilense TaxID=192 RepID=UPI001B3C10A0